MKSMKKTNLLNSNKGISLVELIVVITIMVILAGVVTPKLIKYTDDAKKAKDLEAARTIGTSLERLLILDEQAYAQWSAVGKRGSHVEYQVVDYMGETYELSNVFEFAMTTKRKGVLRDARGDCSYLRNALIDEIARNNLRLNYTKYSCGLLRIGKRLSDGRVEVWICPVPNNTDGEGRTNGWLYYRLYPDPDPRFMTDEAPVGINAKGMTGRTF